MASPFQYWPKLKKKLTADTRDASCFFVYFNSVNDANFYCNYSNNYPITKKVVDMQHNVGAKADIVRIEVRVQAFVGKRDSFLRFFYQLASRNVKRLAV
jgi:hypothetical protein